GGTGPSTDWSGPTSGFTLDQQENNGNPLGLASLYKVLSATGAQSTSVGNNQNPSYYGVIVTYKCASTSYTSNVISGNWSSSSTGPPTGVPGAGATATIANGHTVTVDVNTTVGTVGSSGGVGITVNGASSSSYGTLQVAGGVTLTLQGNDTSSNAMMLVNQY